MRPLATVVVFALALLVVVASPAMSQQRITTHTDRDWDPDWSHDGSQLVFPSDRSESFDIWVIPPTPGSPATQITEDPLFDDQQPAWSPNDSLIAFERGFGGNANIWVIPATGGTATQITTGDARSPAWSPDGSQIAFHSPASNADIWVIPATGGTATQITTHPGDDRSPDWSHDGSQIAFQSDRGGNWDIWVIPATGGTAQQITTQGHARPVWSFDGSDVAFESGRTGRGEIWVIPASGGVATPRTANGGYAAAWSPDGSQIAFCNGIGGNWDIWVIGATTALHDQPSAPARVVLGDPVPNPFNPQTRLTFDHAGGTLELNVYDVQGRLLRRLAEGPWDAGHHTLPWDGRDAGGRQVSSGVYLFHYLSGGEQKTVKGVMVR